MDTQGMDRISNLPCHLISEILKLLPFHDAVRTSILSRDWRSKWRTIPYLVFDRGFERKLHGKHMIDSVIYQVLLLRRQSILKFTLESHNDYDANNSFGAAVNRWLDFLSDHRIEELTLGFGAFSFSRCYRIMPPYLFSFDHLKHLRLRNCSIKLPVGFKGFARLITLELENVGLIEHTKLISKCPMLELIILFDFFDLSSVDPEIDAPNLKCFGFFGKCHSIYFKHTPFLERVLIMLDFPVSGSASAVNLIKYFDQLSSIKKFQLNLNFLQFLSTGHIPQKLPNNLSHLSDIKCKGIDFAAVAEVRCALCLMRSSPNLLRIELHSTTHLNLDRDMKPCIEFLKDQQKFKLSLGHPKNVRIVDFSGSKPEMEFVKLILSGANSLGELKLFFSPKLLCLPLQNASKEGCLKELAEFRRASSEAKIKICLL